MPMVLMQRCFIVAFTMLAALIAFTALLNKSRYHIPYYLVFTSVRYMVFLQ